EERAARGDKRRVGTRVVGGEIGGCPLGIFRRGGRRPGLRCGRGGRGQRRRGFGRRQRRAQRGAGERGAGFVDVDGFQQHLGRARGAGLGGALRSGGEGQRGEGGREAAQPGEKRGGVGAAHFPV